MVFATFFSKNRHITKDYRRRRRQLKIAPLLILLLISSIAVSTIFSFIYTYGLVSTLDFATPIQTDQPKSNSWTERSGDVYSTTSMATLQNINGWVRLKPSYGGTEDGESDSLTRGKSCRWQPTNFYYYKKLLSWIFFSSRASFFGTWICRDCGEDLFSEWESCPLLKPRGKCQAFEYQGWEDPKPRSASSYDPFTKSSLPVRLITSYGVGKVRKVEYEQPQCLSLSKPCFDMNRCTTHTVGANDTNTKEQSLIKPLPVFAYPGQARVELKDVLNGDELSTLSIRIVKDPGMACLLIVHQDDLKLAKQSPSWNLGTNHYVYGVTKPITENLHYDMAALGSVALTEAQIRPGYDIPLPLAAVWKVGYLAGGIHRPRKYLLSFKGSIQDTLQPYYQHRWLAAEYLNDESDVVIDVQCKHKTLFGDTVTYSPYDNPSQSNFDDLMINSTFAFCPGGSHVTSFRLTEVLSAGAIPILLPEIIPPFYPEVDWSDCVIRVSQARIVDLPRILRAISPKQIRERQQNCHLLYQSFFDVSEGGANKTYKGEEKEKPSPAPGSLASALQVWHLRIKKQSFSDQLEKNLINRML